MKLTDFDTTALKNFATINSGLVLNEGTLQRTISPDQSILAIAVLNSLIPFEFGIYDLNSFLGNVSALDDPELTFTPTSLNMSDNTFSITYFPCMPSLIITPPNKNLELKDPDVKFTLTNAIFTKILRIGTMNNFPHFSIVGKNGELSLLVNDRSNSQENSVTSKIGPFDGKEFCATFKTENLKLIPDDYVVEIKLDGFAKFTSVKNPMIYFVALENLNRT